MIISRIIIAIIFGFFGAIGALNAPWEKIWSVAIVIALYSIFEFLYESWHIKKAKCTQKESIGYYLLSLIIMLIPLLVITFGQYAGNILRP
jgi:uncharacterized membrane protein